MAVNDTYTIHLPQFEGPFDLLLFFIERDELDINDIPIATITDDFLDYLHHLERMNIDMASEFILVAATLCRIKAKLLLPRKQLDESGNEIDPREELVQRLLEYKRYKSVLDEMREMEEHRSMQETRGNITQELQQIATKALVDTELETLTLFRLLRAFENVMQRFETPAPKAVHQIARFNYSIEGQQEFIYSRISNGQRADFKAIFGECIDRIHAIITFLALLDMVNLSKIKVLQGEGANNFWLEVAPNEELVSEWEEE
ncbi:segregation and condensation protein A [Haliscomenobacter hydrossis]|uniref:Segregation and condensation protein A n=1 Tax=Haliscomenobacter hydrossis (strain ATCC 27775 / DSM 1100 / LMG 10767 / O) TaxID=760192 RepID=F4L1Y8_HALH1|nr:segregation/condensation protein A [Haliscomenobacter hydrossis]AEE50621.1 Segregation and condensation protein A [Haliscomenobacter hydrossis DSM 1100]